MPCSFDGGGELPLMAGTRPCLPPGINFGPVRDVTPEPIRIFVVDHGDPLYAERAYLSPRDIASPAPRSARTTPRTTG